MVQGVFKGPYIIIIIRRRKNSNNIVIVIVIITINIIYFSTLRRRPRAPLGQGSGVSGLGSGFRPGLGPQSAGAGTAAPLGTSRRMP